MVENYRFMRKKKHRQNVFLIRWVFLHKRFEELEKKKKNTYIQRGSTTEKKKNDVDFLPLVSPFFFTNCLAHEHPHHGPLNVEQFVNDHVMQLEKKKENEVWKKKKIYPSWGPFHHSIHHGSWEGKQKRY